MVPMCHKCADAVVRKNSSPFGFGPVAGTIVGCRAMPAGEWARTGNATCPAIAQAMREDAEANRPSY